MGSGLPSSRRIFCRELPKTRSFFSPGDKTQVGSRILFSALVAPQAVDTGLHPQEAQVRLRAKGLFRPWTRRCPRRPHGGAREQPAPPGRRWRTERGPRGLPSRGGHPRCLQGGVPARWNFLSAAKSGHLVNRFCLKQWPKHLLAKLMAVPGLSGNGSAYTRPLEMGLNPEKHQLQKIGPQASRGLSSNRAFSPQALQRLCGTRVLGGERGPAPAPQLSSYRPLPLARNH